MREIIENKARPITDKPSKLDVLKKVLLSVKRLPLGVITTAEKICQCAKDELKNYLEYHGTNQNFQYFQEYVKDHFNAAVVSLQPQATTSTSTGESASIPATPVIAPSDSVAFLRRDLSGMDMASDMSSVSGAPSHAAMSSISHNPSDISMVEAPPRQCRIPHLYRVFQEPFTKGCAFQSCRVIFAEAKYCIA
ncbi:Rho GTPase [Mucor velutinosus]|uniref:Rho GTPase n=1 Tax=Mucor velutinosus TaxID=708070 RepID=A0AAN7DQZ1_9FUNG|nr:Rho GTPase [Mucor velutinosus]